MPPLDPIPEPTSAIILSAVQKHEKQLGVGSLALLLKGSKDKKIWDRKLYDSPFYGAFLYYPLDVITNFIKQLIEGGFVKSVLVTGNPYPLPLLMLTETGNQTLKDKTKIILEVKRTVKPIAWNESIRETLASFRKNKTISLTAQERNLADSTIWTHLITAVRLGAIFPREIIEAEKIRLILETKEKFKTQGLKELKEALPENISYEEIKCVLAGEEIPHR